MKFGKYIQKRQLEIPEYAASFVDYKALKKLIKKLSATSQSHIHDTDISNVVERNSKASLQRNNAAFLFRLERELEKVNKFYLQKEAELKLRLQVLLERKRAVQAQSSSASRLSSNFYILDEGFRQYSSDLNKLQQFVDTNATAFSKILKKWDKINKSRTKELFLSRAVEVQPCFNREVISHLADLATTNLLDLSAWAEGEKIQYSVASVNEFVPDQPVEPNDIDLDSQILQAATLGDEAEVRAWLSRLNPTSAGQGRASRVFLSIAEEAPNNVLNSLIDSGFVDIKQHNDINGRNCLHSAAISGNLSLLQRGIFGGASIVCKDNYGRMPLHYACLKGHNEVIRLLVASNPETVDTKDQDGFTPLIHAIVNAQLACVQTLLQSGALVDPVEEIDNLPNRIPLNLACQHSSLAVIKLLLNERVKIIADAEGLYPQHVLARYGRDTTMILTLKEYGVDLDQHDRLYQWTPLIHAANEGHFEALKCLLACGVSTLLLDEKGHSALYYATLEGHDDCMRTLAPQEVPDKMPDKAISPSKAPNSSAAYEDGSMIVDSEPEGIPPISLPPPIIPLKRYGHNFLDSKTFVVITLNGEGSDAMEFYDNSKYPAARLMITSKSSDLVPRSLTLPVQDEDKTISFQIDNLETFSIDFDIFPSFGSKVIGRTVASSKIFTSNSNNEGKWYLEIFDPRLQAIGRMTFHYQVLKPFPGIPLEMTNFATYWKATSQSDTNQNPFVTGSSLSGEYVRLFIQMTADSEIILCSRANIEFHGLKIPIRSISYAELKKVISSNDKDDTTIESVIQDKLAREPNQVHHMLVDSYITLRQALKLLPLSVRLELHIIHSNRSDNEASPWRISHNVNNLADSILSIVFEHSKQLRQQSNEYMRSLIFSSFNQNICLALNWKQPNFPVLLCDDLSFKSATSRAAVLADLPGIANRRPLSLKEAIRTAQTNNFVGIVCCSELLKHVPALVQTIRSAGLVLVADLSEEEQALSHNSTSPSERVVEPPGGVDGYIRKDGVLKFHESVEM